MCSARNKSSVLFAFLHRWLQLQEQTQFGTIPFSPNAMHCTYLLTASFLSHLLFIEKKSFLWFITKYPADKLILPHSTFQVIFNFRMINLTSAIAQDIWQQRWKFKNAIHMLTKNRPIHPTHPLFLHKAPKAHFVSHTNQKKRYQQHPSNRNSGNKDTNYMLAILDSRMKIVAHERFQYVLLKKFGE